jgi:hypothetical protein
MRLRLLPSIACSAATALALHSLPAQAFPSGSVNLFQLDRHGLRVLPIRGLPSTAETLMAAEPAPAASQPLAAAPNAAVPDVSFVEQPGESFVVEYTKPLPKDIAGDLVIQQRSLDPSGGPVLKRLPINSPDITISPDRLSLSINHGIPLQPGQTVCVLLPQVDGASIPTVKSPCCFAPKAVALVPEQPPVQPVAPPPSPAHFPGWIPVAAAAVVGIVIWAATDSNGGSSTTKCSRSLTSC